MPWVIVQTRKSPPGYRVQKKSDKSFMSGYDMTLLQAKKQLLALHISEATKKIPYVSNTRKR